MNAPPEDGRLTQGSPTDGRPRIDVEIVYALADAAIVKRLSVAAGATVGEALALAAADALFFREVELSDAKVGIFGKVVPRNQPLENGDRIEIYRPLAVDPKIARRRRAK